MTQVGDGIIDSKHLDGDQSRRGCGVASQSEVDSDELSQRTRNRLRVRLGLQPGSKAS